MELYYKRKLIPPPPKEAEVIIEALRRDVKPKHDWNRMGRCKEGKCPMGLHSLALSPTPATRATFSLFDSDTILAFYQWWDKLCLGVPRNSSLLYERASHYIWP